MATIVHGEVEAGYEPVRDAFLDNFDGDNDCPEVGASLCITFEGETVVDLWAGEGDFPEVRGWRNDTLVNTFSTTKGVAALCVVCLESQGLIDYDAPVCAYWPEFAAAGKSDIKVKTLLSHQAGLSGLRQPLTVKDLFDWQKIVDALAQSEPLWEPGTVAGYHAWTWGFLAGELVRRVLGNQTLPQYLKKQLTDPLRADFYIGLSDAEIARVANLRPPLGEPAQSQAELSPVLELTLLNPLIEPEIANDPRFRAAELAAMNGAGSARGLARLYAPFSNDGVFEGVRVADEGAFQRGCAVQFEGEDMNLGADVRWGAAGLFGNNPKNWYGPNPAAFGHSGWGGSMGFADPTARLSLGYTPNQMDTNLNGDPRGLRIVDALYRSIG